MNSIVNGHVWLICKIKINTRRAIFCVWAIYSRYFFTLFFEYKLVFRAIFAILLLSVWWRFVAMLRSKQDVPNDQVNPWFPLLTKFHLIDERLERLLFLLFMYAFYLLPQNGILNIQNGFFFLYMILWYSAIKIYLFLSFLGLQDSLSWSGCLSNTVSNTESFKYFPNVLFSY